MAHGQDELSSSPDETHVSPDGVLTLQVFYGDNPMLRFAGFPWHVHGDHDEVTRMAAALIAGELAIDVRWKDGVLADVSAVMEDDFHHDEYLERARRYALPGERIGVRTWRG